MFQMMANAARRIEAMFPGYFHEAKHNHYKDFGWPEHVTFQQLYSIYHRNGLARAGVDKTTLKTWQDDPEIWETTEAKESGLEADIRQHFDDLMVWQALAEADKRGMVGGYAGVVLRLADGKRFDQPVDRVNGGLSGLVEVIPAWGGQGAQLEVAEWETDEVSEDYGKPKLFRFNEAAVGNNLNQVRHFMVHPDRVLVWSKDGTVHCRSDLEAGFNDLLDAEKVKGAGGEGFYKSARGNPVLKADKDLNLKEMAKAMGVPADEIADKMNAQVEDYQRGFDRMLFLQGMEANTLPVTLQTGDTFFNAPVACFAASLNIPVKILLGSQTGERASTEDANEWAIVNNARRVKHARPRIRELLSRLERFGIIPERDWNVHWADLTEASKEKKIDRAAKMAEINAKQRHEPVWLPEEIRLAAGDEGPAPDTIGDEE